MELFNGYFGANDGARTRDNQNHNLGLYQLSYVRRCRGDIIAFCSKPCQKHASRRLQSQKQPNPQGLNWHPGKNQQLLPYFEP